MKLTDQQRADLRALAERFLDRDLGLALSSGCLNLLADLEEASRMLPCGHPASMEVHSAETGEPLYCEACDDKSGRKDAERRESELCSANASLRAELAATRQQLAHWKSNHDNVVKKLRLFTQRDDLPVDRLPAYQHMLELEQQLAEAQAFIQSISDQLPEKPDNWSSCSQCQSNSASAEDFLGGAK